MRPNLDIDPDIHYRVKAWAKQEDLSVTEAYEWLLREGLSNEGALPDQD